MSVSAKTPSGRPIVFFAVGILNTLLDFGFYTLLTTTLFRDPSQIALAGAVSGTFSLLCAYITHSVITWRGRNIKRTTLAKFFAVTGLGMWILRPLLLAWFITFTPLYSWVYAITTALHIPFSFEFTANTISFGFMVCILMIYNYMVYEHYVFKEKRTEQKSD